MSEASRTTEDSLSSRRMRLQRERDTRPELELRSQLFRLGLRYRVHRRPVDTLRREADIVFSGARVAVFVQGCFWHGCASHITHARTNEVFWSEKIATNQRRDRDTFARLLEVGWLPVEVWEHEDPQVAARRIAGVVAARQSAQDGTTGRSPITP